MNETFKPGNMVYHSKYGMGKIRTVMNGEMEIDFYDGQRRFFNINSKKIKIPSSNKRMAFIADGVPDAIDDDANKKHYIKDLLRNKSNEELKTLCDKYSISYAQYALNTNKGLYRMHLINALVKPLSKEIL